MINNMSVCKIYVIKFVAFVTSLIKQSLHLCILVFLGSICYHSICWLLDIKHQDTYLDDFQGGRVTIYSRTTTKPNPFNACYEGPLVGKM